MHKMPAIPNRRVAYDYNLGKKLIAGIVLNGQEVSYVRQRRVSLKGAFININRNEVWLKNFQIFNPQPTKTTKIYKLLLTRQQIKELQKNLAGQYNTIVLVRIILGRYIKIELAPAIGKKRYDKRAQIKQTEMKHRIQRRIKEDRRK